MIHLKGESYFIENDRLINIWETDQSESEIDEDALCYMYDIYPFEYIEEEAELSNDKIHTLAELINYIEKYEISSYDGGLCTGTIEDAIEMALQQY